MEQAFADITATNANIKPGRTRIKQRPNGLYKMTTNFTGGTANSTIKAEISRISDKSPKPLISTFTLKVTGKEDNGQFNAEREFTCTKGKDCLFGEKDNPIGASYKITMILLDKDGKPIGKTTTTTVEVVQEYAAIIRTTRRRTRMRKRRRRYHMTVGVTGGTETATVKAEIERISDKSPTPLISTFTLNITEKDEKGNYTATRDFSCLKEACLFNKDDKTVGEKYKITMVVVDKDGNAISEKVTTEVTIEKDDSECKNKILMDDLSISGFNFYAPYSEENNSDYPLLIKDKNNNGNTISVDVALKRKPAVWFYPSSTRLTISSKSSSNSETTETTITPMYNEKEQLLTAKWPDMDSSLNTSMTITTTVCGEEYKTKEVIFNRIESVQGDEIHFKLKKGKETSSNDKDSSSNAALKLSKGITLNSSINGAFQIITVDGIKITQKDKALTDLEVEAIVEMKNCKDATIYVSIPLKYNEKTGTYTNSKALALCNKAGMTVLSMDVVAKGKGLPSHKWTHVAVTHSHNK